MPVAKDLHRNGVTGTQRDEAREEVSSPAGLSDVRVVRRASAATSRDTEADIHLIRLCLDLQLDAMLLALGAAAAQPSGQDSPPWGRWVSEDMQMACALAADVIGAGATLPPTLGSDLDHQVPAAAVDNVSARYEVMETLLADVVRSDAGGQAAPHRARGADALTRCRERLGELRASRLEHTPPRGLPIATQATGRSALPGEWLG